ncbi:SMI1/KNR4 family protein, partial [Stieleria sp. ICT_E10.1]|uniref:SMI1/KNR4 family protein n=1 Tax=Stieleria sedimenti TaxID=2976331 RepID=UPI00217FBDAD
QVTADVRRLKCTAVTDADLDSLLEAFRAKHAFMFEGGHVISDGPISYERLAEIEQTTGIALPHQYKRHLNRVGSGDIGFSSVYTPELSLEYSLWREYEYMPQNRGRFLPFADNGCGDYYGFCIVDGICSDPVCWADHECDYDISEPEYPDFNTFLAEVALKS